MLKSVTAAVFIFLCLRCAAQSSKEYAGFYDNLVQAYAKQTIPPVRNVYTALDNTIAASFSAENPYFLNAVKAIRSEFHFDEATAVDTLFKRSFKRLVENDLWISNQQNFVAYEPTFMLQSKKLCACISDNAHSDDMMQKIVQAFYSCSARLMKDSSFVAQAKASAGNIDLKSLAANQQIFALYMYQHCDIIKNKFDESFSYSAAEKYERALGARQRKLVADAVRYFEEKKVDSLTMIFPSYKKYIGQLNKLSLRMKKKDVRMQVYSFGIIEKPETTGSITLTGEKDFGEGIFTFSEKALTSKITKLKYNYSNENSSGLPGPIMEDQIISTEKVKQ